MSIGILGAGAIGTAVAENFARNGIEAMIANSRSPESLADLAERLGPGIRPVTFEEAARADMVLLFVTFIHLAKALERLPNWGGRIVVDGTNPVEVPSLKPVELSGRLSSDVVSDLLPGARVVKAFNDIEAEIFNEAPQAGGRRVLFYSGNDAATNKEIGMLMDRMGFFGVDLGPLSIGGELCRYPGGPFPGINFVKF